MINGANKGVERDEVGTCSTVTHVMRTAGGAGVGVIVRLSITLVSPPVLLTLLTIFTRSTFLYNCQFPIS